MDLLRGLGLVLLCLCGTASAQTLVFGDDFDFDTTNDFSGTRGWVSQYPGDNWSSFFSNGVYAKSDESGGTYGSAQAADNLLLQTSQTYSDFLLEDVVHVSGDNDGIGLAFRTNSMMNTYLLVMADGGDIPGEGTGAVTQVSGTVLYAIVDGVATRIGQSTAHYQQGQSHLLRVITRHDAIEIWFDDDRNGTFEPEDRIIAVSDNAHAGGLFGLYCYNAGNGDTDGCVHDEIKVYILDTDDDGITDPNDNCVFDTNALQDDLDGDDVGDVCDPDVDGDGALAVDDCDDRDATRHPGALEACDGVDTDCDGSLDNEACADMSAPLDASAPNDATAPSEDAATSSADAAESADANVTDGLTSLEDGAGALEDGAPPISDGAPPIQDGASALADTAAADDGASVIATAGGGCSCNAAATPTTDLFALLLGIATISAARLRPTRRGLRKDRRAHRRRL